MQKEKIEKTFLVLPQFHAGMLSINDLEAITKLSKKYKVPKIKITSAQRIAFLGMKQEDVDALKHELEISDTPLHKQNKVHYVQACPGSSWCKFGVAETFSLAKKIQDINLTTPLPAKVKVGISGCRMCCCESWVRDVGLIAEKKGWKVTFGGNGAGNPRIGDVITDGLSEEEACTLIARTLDYYSKNSKLKTRTARFMTNVTIEEIRQAVI